MFDQWFFRSDALTRQLSAPLVEERSQYLGRCANQGMSRGTLREKARLLLSIAEYLRLADRPNDRINLSQIERAARRWSSHNWPSMKTDRTRIYRAHFAAEAARWLNFLNRLEALPQRMTVCDRMLAEFKCFMKEERGLSPTTVKHRCDSVRPFLGRLLEENRSARPENDSRTVACYGVTPRQGRAPRANSAGTSQSIPPAGLEQLRWCIGA